ncbi:MAG: hypothetical protein ABSE64_14415 [Vulcanimicrobiaceae bacterium]
MKAWAGILAFVSQGASALLMRWYLVEVRKLDVPLAPDEAIHTYPLA